MIVVPFQRKQSRRPAHNGFLLAETLATFTISAFVLLGLVSALSVLLHAVDRSVAQVQDVEELFRTMSAIGRDVSGLERVRWNGAEPQDFVFSGGPNSLVFASARRKPDGTHDTSVVALREIVARKGTRLMRGDARLSARATGFGDLHFGPQRELGTGSARLRFFYVAPSSGQSELPKQQSWQQGQTLPAAVLIEAVDRETGQPLISVRVPVRANADIGCLQKDNSENEAGTGPQDEAVLAGSSSSVAGLPAPTRGIGAASDAEKASAVASSARKSNGNTGFCGRSDQEATQADGGPTTRAPTPPPLMSADPTP